MTIVIRDATRSDITGIANLHVEVWQETHRGLLPDREVHASGADAALAEWTRFCDEFSPDHALLVAQDAGGIVAFAAGGPARDEELGASGEIYAIYVTRRLQYRGIGTRLMGAMARHFASHGMDSVGLWVEQQNVAAVAFARALGGAITGTRASLDGMPQVELALVWPRARDMLLFDDRGAEDARFNIVAGGYNRPAGLAGLLAACCR